MLKAISINTLPGIPDPISPTLPQAHGGQSEKKSANAYDATIENLQSISNSHQSFFRDIEKGGQRREADKERFESLFRELGLSLGIEPGSFGFRFDKERHRLTCDLQAEEAKHGYRVHYRKIDDRYVFESLEIINIRRPSPNPPSLEELAKALCEQDRLTPRVAELMKDPSLQSLPTIYRRLQALDQDGVLLAGASFRDRAEHAAWVARSVAHLNRESSSESIVKTWREIKDLQKQYGQVPLFRGRTAVLLAHQDTLADALIADGEKRIDRKLNSQELQRCRREVGDDRLFGRTSVVEGIQAQLGDPKALTVIRAEDKLSLSLLKLMRTHQDLMSRWQLEDRDPQAPTVREIDSLKTDLRRLLALPKSENISIRYLGARPRETARIEVLRGTKTILRCSLLVGEDGRPQDIDISLAPKVLPPSADEAKAFALKSISTLPPGKEGFLFVFEGHGSGKHLSLSDGSPWLGGFDEKPKSVRISAEELAQAFTDRQKRFSNPNLDVVILKCCFSTEFARDFASHLERHHTRLPIIICQSEYGQFGYSELSGSMNPFQKSLYAPSPKTLFLGDLIQLFGEHRNFDSNPSILVPGRFGFLQQISSSVSPSFRQSLGDPSSLRLPSPVS